LAQALEGKDVKDLLTNVGSGGGAAAVSSGGAAGGAGGAAPAEDAKVEEKEEGMRFQHHINEFLEADLDDREGRVRRGYGFRTFRLRDFWVILSVLTLHGFGLSSLGAIPGRSICSYRIEQSHMTGVPPKLIRCNMFENDCDIHKKIAGPGSNLMYQHASINAPPTEEHFSESSRPFPCPALHSLISWEERGTNASASHIQYARLHARLNPSLNLCWEPFSRSV
jgi:hypothetical protein